MLVVALALVVLTGTGAWFVREALLRTAASWWIVSDPLEPSDAVAVFGGGLEDRPFAAADYYKQGLARRIVISQSVQGPAELLGIVMSHVSANRQVLLKLGVPETAIEVFGHDLSNTYGEAVALREWAQQAGVHSIIVPTEIFAARRVAWTLHHAFGDEASIRVVALDPLGYTRANWWRGEAGVVTFQNEIIKYLYYRAKY
ncbi:MAG TPA: YdcF family protein [Stellaceae bacterium]|nr:YdcF family protein [Stellaceae bacterium]